MRSMGDAYKKMLNSDGRHFKLKLYDANNQELDVQVKHARFSFGSCGDNEFAVGVTYSGSVELTLVRTTAITEGMEIIPRFTISGEDSTGQTISTVTEMGRFVVQKPAIQFDSTTFTAVDYMLYLLESPMDNSLITDTSTIGDYISIASTASGCSIDLRAAAISGMVPYKKIEASTCREVVEIVASMCMGYAYVSPQGQIIIEKYDSSQGEVLTIHPDLVKTQPTTDGGVTTFNGIKVRVTQDSEDEEGVFVPGIVYEEGTDRKLEMTNEYMTQTIFDAVKGNIIGFSYQGASVTWMGNYLLEPIDWVSFSSTWEEAEEDLVTQANQGIITQDNMQIVVKTAKHIVTPCMSIVHEFDGGLTTTVTAVGSYNITDKTNPPGPLTRFMTDQKIVNDRNTQTFAALNRNLRAAWVVSVVREYCLASAREIPAGGDFEDIRVTTWSTTVPTYVEGDYYWTRVVTTYRDGSILYGDPILDLGNQAVADAAKLASQASQTAGTAKEIAEGVESHFWYDDNGAHVSDTEGSTATGNSQTIAPTGTIMRRNGKVISSWTGSGPSDAAINFYDCSQASEAVGNLIASYGRAGIAQYINNILAMQLTANGLSFFTPDSTRNQEDRLQAIFGPSGVNLYALGVLAMALASGSLKFYDTDGTTELASFGTSGSQIGKNGASRMNIAEKEVSATADDNTKYFSLANVAGGTVTAKYSGVSQSDAFYAYGLARRADIVSVTVDGADATYSLTWSSGYNAFYVTISSPSVVGKTVLITYNVSSSVNGKSFTFGTRLPGITFAGGYSASFGEDHIATGLDSFAAGKGNVTPWDYSAAFGKYNIFSAGAHYSAPIFSVGNGTSDSSRSNALAVDSYGNMEISGELTAKRSFAALTTSSDGFVVASASDIAVNSGVTVTVLGDHMYAGGFFVHIATAGYYRITIAGHWTVVSNTSLTRKIGVGVYNSSTAGVSEVMYAIGRDSTWQTRSAEAIVHVNANVDLCIIANDAGHSSGNSTLGTTRATFELVWPD